MKSNSLRQNNTMKTILQNRHTPFLISAFIFVFLQLQGFNLGIGFRDEGFLYLNSLRILHGEIPYRDFFMTTTPGSFYLQTFIIQLFGNYFIWGRLLYILCIVISMFFIWCIYRSRLSNLYIVLVSLAFLFVGPASFGFYNVEGLAIALGGFYLLRRGLEKKIGWNILLSGILAGLLFVFKQSYGVWVGGGLLFIILIERFKQHKFRDSFIWMFVMGSFSVLIPFFAYYLFNHSIYQFYYYTVIFARMVKNHRSPFIIKSILLIPFFYLFFRFIPVTFFKKIPFKVYGILLAVISIGLIIFLGKLSSYLELSRLYYAVLIVLPVLIVARVKVKTDIQRLTRSLSIFLLVFFLANASSGRELGAVIMVSPLLIPVVLELIDSFFPRKLIYSLFVFIIISQVFYLSWNSINPNGKISGIYNRQQFSSSLLVPQTKFIKVSKQNKQELNFLITYLDTLYPNNKKLLCFPYCPMMNVLADRNSPSYFSFFYQESFLPQDQLQVIQDIKRENPILLIQKKGNIEPEANFEDRRLSVLKHFITSHMKKLETQNFIVYN
jgi:hypothetical protein